MQKIYLDQSGAVITTNDKTLVIAPDVTDITDHKDREEMVRNSKYFKLKNGKIVEKTAAEKAEIDERLKPKQQEDSLLLVLQDIQTRLTAVENALAVKKPKA